MMFDTIIKFQELAVYFSPAVLTATAVIFSIAAILLFFTGCRNKRISAVTAAFLITAILALSILKYTEETSNTVWGLYTLLVTMIPSLLAAAFAYFLPRFTLAIITAFMASFLTLAAFNAEELTNPDNWQSYPYEVVENSDQSAASVRETVNAVSHHLQYTIDNFTAAVVDGKLAIAVAAVSFVLVLFAFIVITKIMTCAAFAILAVRFLVVALTAALSMAGFKLLNYIIENKIPALLVFFALLFISTLIQFLTDRKKKRKSARELNE
jgi:hypothetical protein